ncbi:YEATS domain-containing protein 2 [Tribolium castaneum]|uniref:YEATS domain-containing protein n=1 Tax=Tribolium castaneum TaxID=7070 RepID=D6X3U5_TRICA|nr:PREDICTED: YEATS domain-containing protein 2 [Tribolium castaneum]EEZ97471.1 hypothetical protein TcasGA2_TC011302 [Tribolium castaneum]|eukprot:XP_970708.2 PREDICTED: YEATS domain-containing protein 2 [Tribolium castaneum]
MEHLRDSGKVDPDYESYNSALELNEEEDKKENLIKIRNIIEEEYNKEIFERQEQIEQIELQICKVRKILHLLRYALIMSYYKKKELEYNGTEDEASTSDPLLAPDKQNRIHPALKKLLGKNVSSLDHLNLKDKRKTTARSPRIPDPPTPPESKKIKLDPDIIPQTPPKVQPPEAVTRNRKKTKHRVVIGNISKWMPSSEDDLLTHKWMVYVRGPKDTPDVSHFVDKVVFYLHPSYKPHDVVEVSESPFHLARRGWGEFPVRVQIFFKVILNKPIDVVHNIKLDKTFSGRQTLGNETIVDVFLYDSEVKAEVEHDYCSDVETKIEEVNFDHCYCMPASSEGLPKLKKEKIEQDEDNKLIYGLESYCGENHEKITPNQLVLNRKDIRFNNTKILVFGQKLEGCVLTKLIQNHSRNAKSEANNFKLVLPSHRFKNMGEALPFLFKRLPLFSDLANNANYKRIYPFTASSLKEFVSWNVGKRRSSEWSRARLIKKILTSEQIFGSENWNTKTILMYGRSHDYTPFISFGLFNRESEEKQLLQSCYSSSPTIGCRNHAIEQQEITVNIESDSESPKKNHSVIDITDPHLKLECSFIRQTALDCGIILKPEEIVEGVKFNGAEMMILEAVKCLAENLIRRGKNHRVCTKISSNSSTSVINREDVEMAINERPEMFSLKYFRNERKNFEYFS